MNTSVRKPYFPAQGDSLRLYQIARRTGFDTLLFYLYRQLNFQSAPRRFTCDLNQSVTKSASVYLVLKDVLDTGLARYFLDSEFKKVLVLTEKGKKMVALLLKLGKVICDGISPECTLKPIERVRIFLKLFRRYAFFEKLRLLSSFNMGKARLRDINAKFGSKENLKYIMWTPNEALHRYKLISYELNENNDKVIAITPKGRDLMRLILKAEAMLQP